VTETLIRQRIDDWANAIRARDIDRVLSLYAHDNVSFDLDPPLRYAGGTTNGEPGMISLQHALAPSRTTSAN
jgi:ketosteroid isomerase-like protein